MYKAWVSAFILKTELPCEIKSIVTEAAKGEKMAQGWGHLITDRRHLVLKSPHPSPLSADKGFFGTNQFNVALDFIQDNFFDLRPYVDNLSTSSQFRMDLLAFCKRKNLKFDESKVADLPLGVFLPDIPSNITIDLSLS